MLPCEFTAKHDQKFAGSLLIEYSFQSFVDRILFILLSENSKRMVTGNVKRSEHNDKPGEWETAKLER